MATKLLLLLLLLLGYLFSLAHSQGDDSSGDDSDDSGSFGSDPGSSGGAGAGDVRTRIKFKRNAFPPDFVFGAATSAYQVEGAAYEDGKGQSVWDNFTATYPDMTNGSNGLVADDSYHRYKEDVAAIKELGLDAYRFSIAWTRILPNGKRSGRINWKGVNYYYNLINELLANGIQPYVTIFHWDLPQALEDEYRGFMSEKIVDDFRDYADLLFSLYGVLVKNWVTINEPWSYAVMGYAVGRFPPGRCSPDVDLRGEGYAVGRFFDPSPREWKCKGNSSTEPYIVAHNLLLAHAAAVKVYKDKYQTIQKGEIGIVLNVQWTVPRDPNSLRDVNAARRALAFNYGWFMEPLNIGTYPTEMVTRVGDRLPTFTPEQTNLVKGSFDFIGINYYTSSYAKDIDCNPILGYFNDPCVDISSYKNGKPIGQEAGSSWLHIYPWGIRQILIYTKDRYNNPTIYITENGVSKVNKGSIQPDYVREDYHRRHMKYVRYAIKNVGCKIKGYFIWSLLDNFEWSDGYSVRFGILYVDYVTGSLNRTYKDSTNWLKEFLNP